MTSGQQAQTIYITETPSVTEPHRLGDYARPDLSVAHATASVADGSVMQAAVTLLEALGKQDSVKQGVDHKSDMVHTTPIWLAASRTRALIVSNTQRWKRTTLTQVTRLLLAGGPDLIFVADHGHLDTITEALEGFQVTPLPFDAIATVLPPRTHDPDDATPTTGPTHETAPVPADDWPTFRYEARRLMPPAAFTAVDTAYQDAFRRTQTALTDDPDRTDANTTALLTVLLAHATTKNEATARLRGAQAAHFTAGWNLRIDAHEAISLLAIGRRHRFTATDWHAIRAFRNTTRAGTCALHGLGLNTDQLKTITLADVGHALTTGHLHNNPIPHEAVAILRAAYLERLLDGADEDQPLVESNRINSILNNASKDLGIIVPSVSKRTSHHTKAIWNYRSGFLLQRLETPTHAH